MDDYLDDILMSLGGHYEAPRPDPDLERQAMQELEKSYNTHQECREHLEQIPPDGTPLPRWFSWIGLIAFHEEYVRQLAEVLHTTGAEPCLRYRTITRTVQAIEDVWTQGVLSIAHAMWSRSQALLLGYLLTCEDLFESLFFDFPVFTSIWVEVQGNLARSIALITESQNDRAGSIRWYARAAEKFKRNMRTHPGIGRLYQARSLVIPINASSMLHRAKALTAIDPARQLVQMDAAFQCDSIYNSANSMETNVDVLLPEVFMKQMSAGPAGILEHDHDHDILIAPTCISACQRMIANLSPLQLCSHGVAIILCSISGLLDFGSPENHLLRMFQTFPSQPTDEEYTWTSTHATTLQRSIAADCFRSTISSTRSLEAIVAQMPSAHVLLMWADNLFELQSQCSLACDSNAAASLLKEGMFPWYSMAIYLNAMHKMANVSPQEDSGRSQNIFPAHSLSEEHAISGLVWTIPCDDTAGQLEPLYLTHDQELQTRFRRISARAIALTSKVDCLTFDRTTRLFGA